MNLFEKLEPLIAQLIAIGTACSDRWNKLWGIHSSKYDWLIPGSKLSLWG
jgi:hypothetical protein